MSHDLLTSYQTVEQAADVLVSEVEAHLADVLRPHRFLRALGRLTLESFAVYGAALSGYGATDDQAARFTSPS